MPSRLQLANAIRVLSFDAVQRANSGHPGMPMGMADIAEVLWNDFLSHNPRNPHWFNRDRFMLSNGHGSMLQYALLHLSGYDLPMDEIKNFRQLHSKTPGHPEYGMTPGVETTTGPLGQGLASGVGMALAESVLAATFNRPEFPIVDHFTYVFAGDGCLMEGISHEVCSLAGTLGLGKLIVFYDDNGISIDGEVDGWFTDNTAERFAAYHWQVIDNINGHDPIAVKSAIELARADTQKPSIIICKTTIGFGAPTLAGSEKTHGAPLGATEIAGARKKLEWEFEPFHIPDSIYASWSAVEAGATREQAWNSLFSRYQQAHPELAREFLRRTEGTLPATWKEVNAALLAEVNQEAANVATRKASQRVLETYGKLLPELLGGSADLTGSNNTDWSGSVPITHENKRGNYLHYGVREFGMAGIVNGLALHAGFIPYGGTFLVFADYARNAIRLSALMKIRSIFVLSHDSIGLGEDGPTHQPIEHTSMLRMTPNMTVWRPCDAVETAVAWQFAIEHQTGPTSLLLSRQNLPHQPRDAKTLGFIARGGYVLKDFGSTPELLIIATGSEVSIAMQAAETLSQQGKSVRVVSMPCAEVFAKQDAAYRESVLPDSVNARIAIEAGASAYWYQYVGRHGIVIGLDRYGESAPLKDVYPALGLTADAIVAAAAAF